MLVDPPAARIVAEIVDDELERAERAVGLGARDIDPGIAEAHDVGPTVARRVRHETRMPLDPPAAGVVAEIGDDELGCLEAAVGLGARNPDPGIAEADDIGAAVAAGVGHDARMAVDPPAASVIAEIAHRELRRPAEMAGREVAQGEGVALHQAGHTAATGAVRAIAVDDAVAAPAAATVAAAPRILVGTAENVTRLVGEDAIDIVRPPAVVEVVHDDAGPADAGIGEMAERVFGEEAAEGPACAEPGADILDIVAHALEVRAEADRRHGGVPPAGLEIGGVRVGLDAEVHVVDVVGEGDAGQRIGGGKPAEAVLHLRYDLDDFLLRKLQRRRRPLHDDDADRDRPFEIRTRRPGRARAQGPRFHGGCRHDRGAALHVPILVGARPTVLGILEASGLAEPQPSEPQALDLAETSDLVPHRPRFRRSHLAGLLGAGEDAQPAVAVDRPLRQRALRLGREGHGCPLEHGAFPEAQIASHVTSPIVRIVSLIHR